VTVIAIQAPAALDVAAVLDLAADHMKTVGYCKRYLYSVSQAEDRGHVQGGGGLYGDHGHASLLLMRLQ